MKKIQILFLLIGLSSCFGKRPTLTTGFEGKPMPSFNLLMMDSTTRLNTKNIPTGEPVVLFYFSPVCPFCKEQTKSIMDQFANIKGIQFYFMSNFPFSLVKNYYEHYPFNKYPNITVGMDCDNYFGPYYNTPGVPYIAIYDKNKKLKQAFLGSVEPKVIKSVASE